jgi:hypothetical protein
MEYGVIEKFPLMICCHEDVWDSFQISNLKSQISNLKSSLTCGRAGWEAIRLSLLFFLCSLCVFCGEYLM